MKLETTTWLEDGQLRWGLCKPGGGDMVAAIDPTLPPKEQESIANQLADKELLL